MGTCETGVLRYFDVRHEASMWSEWLYTYMYSVCIREPALGYASAGLCSGIRASVWRKAGARLHSGYLHEPAQECRRRHAADVPTGPMRKEIPAPGLPERGDATGWCGGGCDAPGCGAGFGWVQFASIYQPLLQFIMYCTSWSHDFPRRPAY